MAGGLYSNSIAFYPSDATAGDGGYTSDSWVFENTTYTFSMDPGGFSGGIDLLVDSPPPEERNIPERKRAISF